MENAQVTHPKGTAENRCETDALIEHGRQGKARSAWDEDPLGFDEFSYVPPLEPVVNHYPIFPPLVSPYSLSSFHKFSAPKQQLQNLNIYGHPNNSTSYPHCYSGIYTGVYPRNDDQFWAAWTGTTNYTPNSPRSWYTGPGNTSAEAVEEQGLTRLDCGQGHQSSRDDGWMASNSDPGPLERPPIPRRAKRKTGLMQEGSWLPPQMSRSWPGGSILEGYANARCSGYGHASLYSDTWTRAYWRNNQANITKESTESHINANAKSPQRDHNSEKFKSLATRLRERYLDPLSHLSPLGIRKPDGEQHLPPEVFATEESATETSDSPEKPKSRSLHPPGKCKLDKETNHSALVKPTIGKNIAKVPHRFGNLAKNAPTLYVGHGFGLSLEKPKYSKDQIFWNSSEAAKKVTLCKEIVPPTSPHQPFLGVQSNLLYTNSGPTSSSLPRKPKHVFKKKLTVKLSKLLGTHALGLGHSQPKKDNHEFPEGPFKTRTKFKNAGNETLIHGCSSQRKRSRDANPAHPPPLKQIKIIGPNDLIVNQGLVKIKMESDYIPPLVTKEEPMGDQEAQSQFPFLNSLVDGVNIAELIPVKEEVEGSEN